MNNSAPIAEQKEWRPSWISRSAISFVSISFYLTLIGLGFAVHFENYWVAVPLMLVCAHCMHGLLIGFHEASHGMLRKNRRFNEFEGYLIGTFSFFGFTLYRVAHQSHHSHMGTQRDEELWPFVEPTVPRWGRVLAAFLELTCGIFFTPFVFVRSFLRKGSTIRSKRIRRRIWIELGVIVVFWTLVLTTVHLLGIWRYFLLVYALPAILAGNLQSWRKYIEHVGLTGSTVRSGTRSIVANNWAGRLVSFTLLHEPYHGVHHLHMGLPHAELPGRADSLQPETPEELPPFRSYGHALVHLLRSLADPRVGSQWHQRKGGVTPGREPADLAN